MDDELPRHSLSKVHELELITDERLRVARLEQEMSEVKKTDHSADVLASNKIPTLITDEDAMDKEVARQEHLEQSSDVNFKQDEWNDSDMETMTTSHSPRCRHSGLAILGKPRDLTNRKEEALQTAENKLIESNLRASSYSREIYMNHCLRGPPGQHVDKKPGDQKSCGRLTAQEQLSYRDRNDQRKLMRLNELHKFSDGTLTRVMEKLDQMVKDFHLYEYNKGMETRVDTYPILLSFTHCGNKSILRVLRIILVILPEHPSETMVVHNEDGNPARANIKQALGYLKDGDGDGNSQFLSCQDIPQKLSRCGRNQMGNEPILALPEGADDFVVYYDARSKDLEACLEKGEEALSERDMESDLYGS
ncbi:hypothetical protein Tco_0459445 [Tanacetum coccineum]